MSIMNRAAFAGLVVVAGALAISASGRLNAADLTEIYFAPLATQGFLTAVDGVHPEGSRRNSYIWSMRWWQDKLYAGTVRDVRCYFDDLDPGYEEICPPPGTLTPEQRGEIWEYTPGGPTGADGTWRRAFQSPLILNGATTIPREGGYRNLVDCDAGGAQNLYAATFGLPGRILYTPDGTTFTNASLLGLDLIHDLGYRAMVCWKGRLWISPSGAFFPGPPVSIDPDAAFRPVVRVNDDPSNPDSAWLPVVNVANHRLLGDPGNIGIFNMAVFDDSLYLGVANPITGFQLWKADGATCRPAPSPCVLLWRRLIDGGGGRPVPEGETANNARIFAFGEFNGYLYWSASETNFVKFTLAEIGRIGPDDRWDLIVGEPRDASAMAADPNFNCELVDTLCVPLSGLGPGFGVDPFTPGSATYIWQLEPHDGVLYVGTLQRGDMPSGDSPRGFDLWRSSNGIDWSIVSDDGFGNPFNSGIRKLVSSPLGLFLGTANSNTIEDGSRGGTGGAEVWLGIGSQ